MATVVQRFDLTLYIEVTQSYTLIKFYDTTNTKRIEKHKSKILF